MNNKFKTTSVRWLLMLVLGASSLAITAQTPKLILAQAKSPLKVSILTSGPGQQLYALFGHTALRVAMHNQALTTFITSAPSMKIPTAFI